MGDRRCRSAMAGSVRAKWVSEDDVGLWVGEGDVGGLWWRAVPVSVTSRE